MLRRLLRAGAASTHLASKAISVVRPYRPMGQGRELLDAQYRSAEWEYLRSADEAPRFGVVSAYCRSFASGGSLLEIGCGEGLLLEQLDRGRYAGFTGLDISSVAIERARSLEDERTRFVCAEAETYVPDRAYDVIVFNEVLEYFDDPAAVVRRYESFATGGHVIASMFAGIHTARARKIWKALEARYDVVSHTRVSTRREYRWDIKVLRLPPSS